MQGNESVFQRPLESDNSGWFQYDTEQNKISIWGLIVHCILVGIIPEEMFTMDYTGQVQSIRWQILPFHFGTWFLRTIPNASMVNYFWNEGRKWKNLKKQIVTEYRMFKEKESVQDMSEISDVSTVL